MKKWKNTLAITLVLAMVLGMAPLSLAAYDGFGGAYGFGDMLPGIYTYVDDTPVAEAGSHVGEVQFLYQPEDNLIWAYGTDGRVTTGVETVAGDELEFFRGLYLSDRSVYDWLASAPRNTEGYAGDVAGNLQITITEEGKLSEIRSNSASTNVLAVVTGDMTADTLTVAGAVRGQPNLLQSCTTMIGSTNGLYLTERGNVILEDVKVGHNENGQGLIADKAGGDVFIVGTIPVDGTVEWANIGFCNFQGLSTGSSTIVTSGKDIIVTGGNVGRQTNLNLSTGEGGGDILLGTSVARNPETGSLNSVTLNTSGTLTAGTGNVVIGTASEGQATVHQVGDIRAADVIIKPVIDGAPADVTLDVAIPTAKLGDVTATGGIDIQVGAVNPSGTPGSVIGNLTAETGDITVVSGEINGDVGDITAPNGTVTLNLASVRGIGDISGAQVVQDIGTPSGVNDVIAAPTYSTVVFDGEIIEFDAYIIEGNNYFKLRDLAYVLSGTGKQFEVGWYDAGYDTIIYLTSGSPYTPVGGEMVGKGVGEKITAPTTSTIYLDGRQVTFTAYTIEGNNYFKLRDIASAFDFGVEWDEAGNRIIIDTTTGYTPEA